MEPRFEFKYCLALGPYHRLRSDLVPHAAPDPFSQRAPNGRYFVRSLYYDTADFHAYVEKLTGEQSRIKLRVRTYARSEASCEWVSVELKTRRGDRVLKFGTHIAQARYECFRRTGSFGEPREPVLEDFERLARLRALAPCVLVDYEREALIPRRRDEVRITFDHAVRARRAKALYPARAFERSTAPGCVILEIKTPGQVPEWLERIARRHGLKARPHSKYANAIERTQAAIAY